MARQPRLRAEKKVMILREHLDNQVPISELSAKYGVHPNAIYKWKKTMFESAVDVLSGKHKSPKAASSKDKKRIDELETALRKRESLITEIVEDNMKLRKEADGPV